MRVELTTDWSPEKFAPYGAAVTAAMKKLQERFPREVEIAHLVGEIIDGKRHLWIILDDDDRFVSFVLTQIDVNDATGLRTLVIPSFAGEEGTATVHLIGDLEAWGKSQGCDETLVFGRWGWKPALEKEGYTMNMVTFRKPL